MNQTLPIQTQPKPMMSLLNASITAGFVLTAALCGTPFSAFAQMLLPLRIVATNAIYDEYGHVMKGSAAQPPSECYRVHILWASNQLIYPPAYDGTPHPQNPLVEGGETTIGNLISPSIPEPGRFVALLANPRPPNNSRLFARVYNATTITGASFYADSQVITVNGNDILIVHFSAVQPIDPRDDDGDGLNNSWEKSLGSDANHPDTDGDGVSDYAEFKAGTGLRDAHSHLATVRLHADAEGNAWLTWSSVPGKRYKVQYADETSGDRYQDLEGDITAVGYLTEAQIPNGASGRRRFYRVRLRTEESP
jgi:hypothetical protein